MTEETRTIELSERLLTWAEERLEYTEFDSTEEYVDFALERLLRGVEERDEDAEPVDSDGVRDQLESLGYL